MGTTSSILDEGDGGSGDATTECAFARAGALLGSALSKIPFASAPVGSFSAVDDSKGSLQRFHRQQWLC